MHFSFRMSERAHGHTSNCAATATDAHGLAGRPSNNPTGRPRLPASVKRAKLTVYVRPADRAKVRAYVASLYRRPDNDP